MQATEPLTEDQALESLLAPQEPVEEQVEDVTEEVADEVESEEVELDAEEAEEDFEEDAYEDDQDHEEEAQEQPLTFTVKVDGEELEVTQEELTRSYSGQKYIQKQMQEAAEQRKQSEAIHAALQQEQARVAQLYQTMQQNGVAPEPVAPDLKMASEDPIGYIEAKAKYDAAKLVFDQQQAEVQNMTAQQTQAQEAAQQAYLQEQRQVLERDIPDFADAEKGKQIMADLRSTGEKYGFTEAELSGIADARTVKVLHDAMQWQKLQAGKGKVGQKVKKARPVTKPKAPRKVNKPAEQQRKLREQLKKSGSVDDALKLLYNGN